MTLETGEQLDNWQDQISGQQIDDMFTKLDTQDKELSNFGKEFQDNLKSKNIVDKNTELVAWLSIMKWIKNPKQKELAKQILNKIQISAKQLASKTEWWISFLKHYIQYIDEELNATSKVINATKSTDWIGKIE